jgi:hypothetical protein
VQNYLTRESGGVAWRDHDNIPPAARFISSPYDLDAHYARKYSIQWVGYNVHLTETCKAAWTTSYQSGGCLGTGQAARRKRRARRSSRARPHIWRLSSFRRLICPSIGP